MYSDAWKIPRDEPQVSNVTESSAVVTWKTIEGLPDDIKQYYKYILEYKEPGQSYMEFRRLDHAPDASSSQQETLTGLRYGHVYVVQVKSVRAVRGLTEETQNTTDPEFTTKCIGISMYMPTATDRCTCVTPGQSIYECLSPYLLPLCSGLTGILSIQLN